jgi:hypothetical protein
MNTVPKPSLDLPQCQGQSVTPTFMKTLHIHKHVCQHTNTNLYFKSQVYSKHEEQQNNTVYLALHIINLILISVFCNI